MKIKPHVLYSTLNPDTNSNFPSAKSNAVQSVSNYLITNQFILQDYVVTLNSHAL